MPRPLLLLATLMACSAPAPSPRAPVPAALPTAKLSDPQQRVRDAAAASLRVAYARDPSRGERAEASWRAQIGALRPGISEQAFVAALHGTPEGGGSSGGSTTELVRLDDFWVAEAFFDLEGADLANTHYRAIGALHHRVRDVWVDPPPAFSGTWTTYYITGAVSRVIDYDHGVYVRFRSYYDNGQLISDDHYLAGQIDGDTIAYHRDGRRQLTGHYTAGKQVGHWLFWFANGKLETDRTYVDGKLEGLATTFRDNGEKFTSRYHDGVETGQAGWSADGTLLYAHGSMQP